MKLIIEEPYRKEEESGSAFAYRVLRHNIMSMRLEPGEVLNEPLLAEELGVSRTPVREALIHLKDDKLVEIHPHRASIVTLIDFAFVREGYFTRTVVEPMVTVLACDFLSPAVVSTLEGILAGQEEVVDSRGDANRFHALNQLFHQTIYEAAGMQELWNSVNAMTTHYDRLRYFEVIDEQNDFRFSWQEHKTLLRAMQEDVASVPALARAQIFNIENFEEYIALHYRRYFLHMDV